MGDSWIVTQLIHPRFCCVRLEVGIQRNLFTQSAEVRRELSPGGKFLPPSPCKKTQKREKGRRRRRKEKKKREKGRREKRERKERRREKGRFLRLENPAFGPPDHFSKFILESIPPHHIHASRRLRAAHGRRGRADRPQHRAQRSVLVV